MTRAVRHVEVSYKTPAYCDSVSTRLGGHDDGLCWHTDEGLAILTVPCFEPWLGTVLIVMTNDKLHA